MQFRSIQNRILVLAGVAMTTALVILILLNQYSGRQTQQLTIDSSRAALQQEAWQKVSANARAEAATITQLLQKGLSYTQQMASALALLQGSAQRSGPQRPTLGLGGLVEGGVGAGQVVKACNQVAVAGALLGVADALALAEAEGALAGFDGDVLILYGDVPFVPAATMQAMIDRLNAPDAPAVVVLAFAPDDMLSYGRVICDGDRIVKMVEHKDATPEEQNWATFTAGTDTAAAAFADHHKAQ